MRKETYTFDIFAAEPVSFLGVQFREQNFNVTPFHSLFIHGPKKWHVNFSVYRPECLTVFTQLHYEVVKKVTEKKFKCNVYFIGHKPVNAQFSNT